MGGGSYFTNTGVHGLYFDCAEDITLVSVKVYADGADFRMITLEDANGTILEQQNINIPDGESRVTLDWQIPIGSGYYLKGPGAPNLWRDNSGLSYAYTVGTAVTITHSSASSPTGFYYYFYDWEVIGASCISPRVPIVAAINTVTDASFSYTQSNLTVDFTASQVGANSYSWDFGDGNNSSVQNPQHIYATSGTYTVELTVVNSCGTDVQTDIVDVVVGISETASNNFIAIYPNPVKNVLTVSYINDINNIKIIDNLGNLVYNKNIAASKTEINLDNINSGIYFMVIESGSKVYHRKVIVTK